MSLKQFLGWRGAVLAALARIETKLDQIQQLLGKEAMTLADLKAQVDANTSLEGSAIQLINGLAAQIKNAANDPAAIQALADELSSSATALSAAISANTPAAPAATN